MNNLNISNIGLTISSLEIAELTGKRHADILRDINIIKDQYYEFKSSEQICSLFQDSEYKAKNGKMNHCVLLSKEFSLDLVTGYNLQARNKINQRWLELENKNQYTTPQTFGEALLLAANKQLQVEKLEIENKQQTTIIETQNAQIEADKDKVDFYKNLFSNNTKLSMNEFAKILTKESGVKIGQNKMMDFLRQKKYLMSGRDNTEKNKPYQRWMTAKYFEVEYIEIKRRKHDNFIIPQAFILAKGQQKLAQQIVDYFKQQLLIGKR